MSDRYDLFMARLQSKDEHVMNYFQPKVSLCRDLSLLFEETRDQLLKRLSSGEMALYALSQKHTCEEDLLSDLLEWTRMSKIYNAENKLRISKPHPNKFELKSKSNSNVNAWPKAVAIAPIKESVKKPTESADESPCFWNCKKRDICRGIAPVVIRRLSVLVVVSRATYGQIIRTRIRSVLP